MPNVNESLDICKREIKNLNSDEVFLLRDFFKGYEWNMISKSDHLLLGTLFFNYINTTDNEVITIEKIFSSQQKYLKATGIEYILRRWLFNEKH